MLLRHRKPEATLRLPFGQRFGIWNLSRSLAVKLRRALGLMKYRPFVLPSGLSPASADARNKSRPWQAGRKPRAALRPRWKPGRNPLRISGKSENVRQTTQPGHGRGARSASDIRRPVGLTPAWRPGEALRSRRRGMLPRSGAAPPLARRRCAKAVAVLRSRSLGKRFRAGISHQREGRKAGASSDRRRPRLRRC
jgi:hypothetical protein